MREDSLVIVNADDGTVLDPRRFSLKSDAFQLSGLGSCKSDTQARCADPRDSILTPQSAALLDPLARNHYAPAFEPLLLPSGMPSFSAPAVGQSLHPLGRFKSVPAAQRTAWFSLRHAQIAALVLLSFLLSWLVFHDLLGAYEETTPPPLAPHAAVHVAAEAPPVVLLPEQAADAPALEAHDVDPLDVHPVASASQRSALPRVTPKPTPSKQRIPWWE